MTRRVGVIPHFKGDVPPVRDSKRRILHEALTTGADPESGRRLIPEEYISVLRMVSQSQREIAENVARVFAAGLQGVLLHEQGDEVQPYFLEGCRWEWGSKPQMGAEISQSLYSVVPERLRNALCPPHVEALTQRTHDEFVHLLRLADREGLDAIFTVTHPYHRGRTSMMGKFIGRTFGYRQVQEVKTPLAIASEWESTHAVQPDEQFLLDAIRIAEPSLGTRIKEGVKEKGPLLVLHLIERMTGEDLERRILDRMSVRHTKGEE